MYHEPCSQERHGGALVEQYRIAGFRLALELVPQADHAFAPAWRGLAPYASRRHDRNNERCAPPDIRVRAYTGPLPAFDARPLLDRGPGFWSAYALGERTLFTCQGTGPHAGVWRAVVCDARASEVEVITRPDASFIEPGAALPHPLAFPCAELIALSHISTRDAAIFHACGVRDHGGLGAGYLFCGRSGAGKSTTARLWQGHGVILNDDRVLVRRGPNNEFRVHGTPWHGDVQQTHPGSAPLRALFFLEHATEHSVVPLSAAEAQRRLLTSVWLPLWQRSGGMAATMLLCAQLVRELPCFLLRFRRDSDVIPLVRAAALSGSAGDQEPVAVPA